MKSKLHLSSLIAPAALLAATSAWAANCPKHTQWNQKYNECYIDLYGAEAGGMTEILVDPTKHASSFKVYGYSANHTVIVKSTSPAWTFSVTGSATMMEGDNLTIKNGINFDPFSDVIDEYIDDFVASYPAAFQGTVRAEIEKEIEEKKKENEVQGAMFECKNANCEVPKQTGFNSLVIEAQATQASSGMDLTVQHEIFDFWTTTVFNVKGVNRSFASLLLGVAGIQFDLSKVPEDATTLALVDADFTQENLAKKAKFVNLNRDIPVDMVYFNRAFTPDVYSTMTLPFDLNTNYALGLKRVLTFNGIKQREVDGKVSSYVSMKRFWEQGWDAKTIEAYKPYLVEMEAKALTIASQTGPAGVTLKKAPIGLDKPFAETAPTWDEHDGWVFYGTLAGCQWTNDEKYMPQYKEGDQDSEENINKLRDFYGKIYGTLGRAYGFAAEATEGGVQPGQFVKAGEGAYIGPYRAFLLNTNAAASAVKGAAGSNSFSIETPEFMDVVIEDEDEQQTTTIGRLNTRTGEFLKAETRVFDLKGRNVKNNAPRARGAYYGKKSVVR